MWRTSTFKRFAALALATLCLASAASAHPSRGIAVGRDGAVYFSDLERIWKIAPDGKLRKLHEHRGVHTHEIAIDRAGNLVGEDSLYDPATQIYRAALWSITPAGRYRALYGSAPAQRGIGVIADARGCRYHADQSGRGAGAHAGRPLLHRKCPGRRAERLAGIAADDRAYNPVLANNVAGMAWGPAGALWFRQGSSVFAWSAKGGSKVAVSGVAAENYGIAVDRAGTAYVAEGGNRRILKVRPNGVRTAAFRSRAPWFPTGVALARGAIYVLEARDYRRGELAQMRVVRKDAAGKSRVLAVVTVPEA